jgi:outer membrane protein TolC
MIAPLLLAALLAGQAPAPAVSTAPDTSRLTLAGAVRKALDTNPAVAAARAGSDAAQAVVGEAAGPLYPRLSCTRCRGWIRSTRRCSTPR